MPSSPFPGQVSLGALILAAGKGTRMRSDRPKVLQTLLEEPLLRYVLDAALALCPDKTWTVVGHGADLVGQTVAARGGRLILQEPQQGTGHALQVAWPALTKAGLTHVLVLNGDTPLMREETLRAFLAASLAADADLAFISLTPKDPAAYGRVIRTKGLVEAIVEARDYDEALHGPPSREINAGVYCLRLASVAPLLSSLKDGNRGREFYITDLAHLAVFVKLTVLGHNHGDCPELLGINTPQELIRSEEFLREAIIRRHLEAGVLIRSPQTVRIGPDVELEPGASVTGPAELYGRTFVRRGARISSHCRLTDTRVGEGASVHSFSLLQEAEVGANCVVGPYARLRPGAILEEEAHAGNFVELKKTRLGRGAKANHLAYLGDADIGAGTNIGAGTITCNYDGTDKHQTVIGRGAFIGSNASLVAPLTIGDGTVIGAGSVITEDVPAAALAIARSRQRNTARKK
ncbi:MAG: bifunctional UDP-N-acetylglucosamine diphosphorylase/glucosamine-1-phosphate N-acetyltransferase GlmU [Desulfovibrio sp.]|jgi:bifunctional UDP-N-acetylglucosamine pyrophosphorylase/glucosamine-1-phosphate N-acetyltransferase|nr:bifunctional UDP-N-acetylglucosamine diphosphorylase/glucosamine-1-phosphate N-acetyltransferase GlmU [Desulfovibrio sp.]